jgi:hypothetical protein
MTPMLQKPELAEVHEFLRRRDGLIVHFSGAPKGAGIDRGEPHLFPTDLRYVVEGHAMGGLSCSVVVPGDKFHGFERNATGCIGVVLDLTTKNSLVAVAASDCGSIESEGGKRIVQNEIDIAPANLDLSLDKRTDYNEWIINNYKVRGIFAVSPYEVSILTVLAYSDDMPEELRDGIPVPTFRVVSLQELVREFPTLPIYTFNNTSILQYANGHLIVIDHAKIYSPLKV